MTSLYKILGNNCDPLHLCPPYFDGRISNGPVASEQLASNLFPGSVTSTNFRSYAVAGAGSGGQNGGFNPGSVIELRDETGTGDVYRATPRAKPIPMRCISFGAEVNDYLTKDSPVEAAQNIGGYVSTLAAAGAQHFLVPNLPDLSLTPFIAGERRCGSGRSSGFFYGL